MAENANVTTGDAPVATPLAYNGTSKTVRPNGFDAQSARLRWRRTGPVILTAITFVAMMAGLVADWRLESPWLAWALYGVAYPAGGIIAIRSSIRSLRKGVIDIDILMILAAIGALVIGAPFEGAMLLFLFSLSNVLQSLAMGRTRRAIEALMELRPDVATVVGESGEVTLGLDGILPGSIIRVRPGERIPLDGTIVSGESLVDQSAITGESVPVERSVGESVFAGTFNQEGSLDIRTTAHASESTLARLVKLVEQAQSQKAVTQRTIERAEQAYAASVLGLTAVAIILPISLLGEAFDPAFYRAMTLMVAASPCALVISTPATVLSAIGNGARRGILFKGGAYVERAAAVKVIAFDKTGTLTEGHPRLTDIHAVDGMSEDALLSIAASVQYLSEHHLARALRSAAEERGLEIPESAGFRAEPGRGVEALLGSTKHRIGNTRHFADDVLAPVLSVLNVFQSQGKTAVLMTAETSDGEKPIGLFAFRDSLRPGVPAVLEALRKEGIQKIVMLTGDNAGVAEQIGREAGVDEIHSGLLPDEKVALIRTLEERHGAIAMVGDGVNDAPALAAASLGIAMGGAGTDVALETADVVLMADDLARLPYLIALSRATRRTLITNLTFAMGVIVVLITSILAVGIALPLAVLGHEGSTVVVSLNGLRLLGFNYRLGDS